MPLMRLYRCLTPGFLNPLLRRIKSRTIVRIALRRVYGKRAHFTRRDVEEYFAPSQFPDYGPAVRQALHSYDWSAAKHRRLGKVNVPAVGIWGTLDHMMPKDGMDLYLDLIPQIVLSAIPNAGHIIAEETPHEVNEALLALLRRVYLR